MTETPETHDQSPVRTKEETWSVKCAPARESAATT